MALQILPPDKLRANARAKVKAFQLEKRKRELEAKRKPREPLEEGIVVPREGKGRRAWRKMSDEQLVAYTKQFIKENGISGRNELQKKDGGLYDIICRRKLRDAALDGIEDKRRSYPTDKQEFVELARQFIRENGISHRTELCEKNSGLYTTLSSRQLLDAAFAELEGNQQKAAVQEVLGELEAFGGKE